MLGVFSQSGLFFLVVLDLIQRMIAKVEAGEGVSVKFGRANHKGKLYVASHAQNTLFHLLALNLRLLTLLFFTILFALLFASNLSNGKFECKVDLVLLHEHLTCKGHVVQVGLILQILNLRPLIRLLHILDHILYEFVVI